MFSSVDMTPSTPEMRKNSYCLPLHIETSELLIFTVQKYSEILEPGSSLHLLFRKQYIGTGE